jgi:hypothetical protein
MNLQIRELCTKLSNAGIPIEDKSAFTELMVAYSVSRNLPLPTTLEGDYQGYFTTHFFDTVREKLAVINEDMVFNIRVTLEYVKAFYMVRLSAAYPGNMLFIGDKNSFFDSASKVDQLFTQTNIDILNKYKRAIMDIATQLSIAVEAK